MWAGRTTKSPDESAVPVFERVAHAGGLERGQRLGGVPAEVSALGAELVRTALRRERGDEDDLLGPGGRDFLEQPSQTSGPIADAVRLAAPRPFGRERHEVRLGGERDRQRRRQRIERVVARRTRRDRTLRPFVPPTLPRPA